jgi:nicotinamide phosphoribosyltransferase
MNLILQTDSYKASHYLQYPEGTTYLHAYLESRGGPYGWTRFFGLQYYLKRYLSQKITMKMVDQAKAVLEAHGLPFDYAGWSYIAKDLKGKLPIEIRAVPEGSVIPNHNVLMTIESTDSRVPWVVTWVESLLLKVWYPTTVATQSLKIKQIVKSAMLETCDNVDGLPFKLHDFGYRGVSSEESAGIGGLAHLTNFMGTDTLQAIVYGWEYYEEPMAGFSIPASEHSTMTSWGKEHEVDAYRQMVEAFSKPGSLYAVVSDSYDIVNAVDNIWGGELRDLVVERGGTLVIRPDSGDPVSVVLRIARSVDKNFGSTINSKGYKVLNNVRIIQGDGTHEDGIYDILKALKDDGFSADNIAFGMGGALLQGNAKSSINRDTHKMAQKVSALVVDGVFREVRKDPASDRGKTSKLGVLELIKLPEESQVKTVRRGEVSEEYNVMRTVFKNGNLLVDDTLSDIRNR